MVIIHVPVFSLEILSPSMFNHHSILFALDSPSGSVGPTSLPFQARISHRDTGGVLNGSWMFLLN
jgi:hypothetical protein